jgi:hypothetical protein
MNVNQATIINPGFDFNILFICLLFVLQMYELNSDPPNKNQKKNYIYFHANS